MRLFARTMTPTTIVALSLLFCWIGPSQAFAVGGGASMVTQRGSALWASSTAGTQTEDLLRPAYEIEKIPIRIGHGFDIHRMAPREEAGQPVVIGGVVIDHKPQKWVDVEGKYADQPGDIFETELGVVAHSDGDVIYHSIVDAIFGALTLPDIGQVFQDTDP